MTDRRQEQNPPRRQFYGRRHGRPLRPARARLVETLLPRLALTLETAGSLQDLRALFETAPEELWLEIGFGAGEHLAAQAAARPEIGFLGAEVFVNGVASLLAHIDREGLSNVRIYQGDGRDLLEALPEAALARVAVLFPDPWPKARHRRRRILQPETLDHLARVLRDGGELRLATDDPDYLSWMLEKTTAHGAFDWLARCAADWRERPADWPPSRYEQKALAGGARPTYLRFGRRERAMAGSGQGPGKAP
ncbi:MAG: tRNA (guanosine(46)-N7)-methyltransferase TrmB [Kiloniellales bacterium]|nr:tRNA (guanosine(46)-N7)-methyltransferase TrmB [Kiloniellales bacterium]